MLGSFVIGVPDVSADGITKILHDAIMYDLGFRTHRFAIGSHGSSCLSGGSA